MTRGTRAAQAWDASDRSAALIDARVDARQRRAPWPPLDPLPEVRSEAAAAFPLDALGPILGPAARAIADAVQAPDSLAAGSVLAAAAVAAQPHADVMMPHGQTAPLSLFLVTSAESGDRKSATDAIASQPIEAQRRRDARDYSRALVEFNANKGSKADAPAAPPTARSVVVSKGTTEGLHHLLKTQPAVGLLSTEGAELVAGHSMREERRAAAIAWLLKAWGGETLDTMTRGDGLSVLLSRRVSLHVLMQPVILRGLLADPLAQGQGWIARCLIAAPATLAGSRMFRDDALPAGEREEVRRYHARLDALMRRSPLVTAEGDGCELEPPTLSMTPEARALWVSFYDAVEAQQAEGAELCEARAWASKAAEQAARISGIRTVIEGAREITGAAMEGAAEVVEFYLREHVRLMGQSRDRLRLQRLHTLADWLALRGPAVPHHDVLQRSPRAVRDLKADGITPLLDELAWRGYVRRDGDQWEVRRGA